MELYLERRGRLIKCRSCTKFNDFVERKIRTPTFSIYVRSFQKGAQITRSTKIVVKRVKKIYVFL